MPTNSHINKAATDLGKFDGSRLQRVTIFLALSLVFVLSLLDIAGWAFSLPHLKSFGLHWESMKLITALSFVFLGLVLSSIVFNLKAPGIKIFTYATVTLIFLISLFSVYIYLHIFITGEESQVIHLPIFQTFLAQNNRMAFLSSVCFMFLACDLFLLLLAKNYMDALAHVLIIPVFIISYFTLISYFLGVPFATRVENVAIALNTGLGFTGICIVVAYIRPSTWLMRFYNLPTVGGIISRKLLIPAIIVPIIIGWLRIQGERVGMFESDLGVVLVAITYSACFLIMVWLTAKYVNRIDIKRRESEETLTHSEERFRTIAETVPVLICITRLSDSVVMFTNEVNNKAFGLRGEEIVGTKGPDYYFDSEDRERMILKLREQGTLNNFELKVKRSDGTPFWIMTSVRPIIYKGQSALIGASIDITELKKIEEALLISEERFRAISENIPDLIVRFDKDLRLQYANPAVTRRTGVSLEFLLGKTSQEYGNSREASENWERACREVLISGKPKRIEQINEFKGLTRVYDTLIVPEMDLSGSVSSVISIARDITEKILSDTVLKNSEQKLKYHLENSPLAVVEWDRDFNIIQWSKEAEKIFGLKKEDVLGVPIFLLNIIYKDDVPKVEQTISMLTSGKESKVISQNRNITKTGEVIECIWYNSVLLDENGEMSSVMSLVEDITLLRRTEKELLESRESYRELVSNARSIIVKLDLKGKFMFVNEFAQEFFGFSKDELLGKLAKDTIMPSTESTGRDLDEMVASIITDPDKYSVNVNENIKKNGDVVWVEWHNKALFDESGIRTGHLAIGIDISKRKLAEDNLKRSEALYRAIGESIDYGVWVCDAEGKNIYASDSYLKMVGMTQKQCSDFGWGDTLHPDDAEKTISAWKECARTGSKWDFEHRFRGVDGKWHPVLARGIPIHDGNGNIIQWAGINLDISSIKKAQDELLSVNRILDAQSKSNHAMIHAENELKYVNDVCKIIIEDCGHTMVWIGYARNDVAKSVTPVAHYGFDKGYIEQLNITWDDTERGLGPTGTAIKTGKSSICRNMQTDPAFEPWRKAAIERGYSSSLVLPLLSDRKSFGAISIYSKEPDSFSESEVKLLAALADDLAYGITYLRLAESEREAMRAIKESENKLKELITTKDKFFNIVAHDLKNPFTSLLGSTELLYDKIDKLSKKNIIDLALILNDSAKGGYAILLNLLDWSRSQTGLIAFNPQDINLKSIIDKNIENTQLQKAKKGISLTSELTDNLFIFSDENMINTILRNLLGNAIKYTHKKGKVVVGVLKSPKEIIVSVRDTGTGMTKQKVDSLFILENSLSTPGTEKEQGTGLGLKLCKEFTEMLGGRIWVISEEGKGSEFKFTIPVKV